MITSSTQMNRQQVTPQITPYQARLRSLVEAAQQFHAPDGKKARSIRGLARLMGDASIYGRITRWMTIELIGEVEVDSLEQLSKVDPKGRTPEEISHWLKTGGELEPEIRQKVLQLNQLKQEVALLMSA